MRTTQPPNHPTTQPPTSRRRITLKTKQDVIQWLEDNRQEFIDLSDDIWEQPRGGLARVRGLQAAGRLSGGARALTSPGTWAGSTPPLSPSGARASRSSAFWASTTPWPGSRKRTSPPRSRSCEGDPGQGCGHNLLGVGCLAPAVALKEWLEATGREGTVRYYGCPAEEQISGKTFMARDGAFDDLDAAFNYHPGTHQHARQGQRGRRVRPGLQLSRHGGARRRLAPPRALGAGRRRADERGRATFCASTSPKRCASTMPSPTAATCPTSCRPRPRCGTLSGRTSARNWTRWPTACASAPRARRS